MEASVGIMRLFACWSVKPFDTDFTGLQPYSPTGRRPAGKDLLHMPVSRQADPHTGADAANDPALMVTRYLGAGHPGAISPSHRRVPVSLCRHRQIQQVIGSDPCSQDQ
jgi:hypothetical protein